MTSMTSDDAVRTIAKRREGALAVVTMGSMNRWFEAVPGNEAMSSVPMMGGASSLGLGLALARSDRRVLVLDGDGSLLMQLGSLVTIARQRPRNLYHFVFDNRIWYSGGGHVAHPGSEGVDWQRLALGAGYASAHRASSADELDELLSRCLEEPGPTLIALDIETHELPPWSHASPQPEMPESQFTRMGDEGRRMRQALAADPVRA